MQHIAGECCGISRVKVVQARQYRLHDCRVTTHVTEVPLAVVRVHAVHVRLRRLRTFHAPGVEPADLHGFFEFTVAQGQERQRPGGSRGMAHAKLRYRPVHGFEPVIQACAGAYIGSLDGLGGLGGDQLAQPLVDRREVVLLKQ
ncbi:hypothetical protein D3C77_574970 [compost metagenome]